MTGSGPRSGAGLEVGRIRHAHRSARCRCISASSGAACGSRASSQRACPLAPAGAALVPPVRRRGAGCRRLGPRNRTACTRTSAMRRGQGGRLSRSDEREQRPPVRAPRVRRTPRDRARERRQGAADVAGADRAAGSPSLSFGHNLSLDQHRPGVDEVEGVGLKSRVSRVCADDLDVAPTPVGDQFECHPDVDRIGVEPNDPPPGETRSDNNSMMPRGPQPTSMAPSPGRRPSRSSRALLSGASSSARRCKRSLSALLLPSAYVAFGSLPAATPGRGSVIAAHSLLPQQAAG